MSGKRLILTVPEVAGMVGLHEKTVRAHVHDAENPLPVLGVPKRGQYTRILASQAFAYYRDRDIKAHDEAAARRAPALAAGDDLGEVVDFGQAKARKEQALADKTTFELRVALGEFVPVEEAQLAMSAGLQEVASQLDAVPARLKRHLPELSHAQMEVIEREIARARNTAADKAGQGIDSAQSA